MSYAATEITRQFLLYHESGGGYWYQKLLHITVVILYGVSALVFLIYLIWYYKEGGKLSPLRYSGKKYAMSCVEVSVVWIFLAIVLTLAIVIPVLGVLRDKHIMSINAELYNDTKTNESILVSFHAVAKFFLLFNVFVICSTAASIFTSSGNKWVESDVTVEIPGSKEVKDIVENKFFFLQNHYFKIGKHTELERETLKRWFVLHYLVFLVEILLGIVQIVQPILNIGKVEGRTIVINGMTKADKFGMVHDCLFFVFDLSVLLVPFFMASWLNTVHRKYYAETLESLYTYRRSNGVVYRPGFEFTAENKALYEDYREYYILATAKNMKINPQFDFVPSIMNIDVPLGAQGYNMAVLLTIMSVVFSFTVK